MSHTTATDKISKAIATLGPVGFLPKAPGTWGSAVAIIAAPFLLLPYSPLVRCIIIALVFVLGGLAADRAERLLGQKDPGCIIIDEVAGQWLVFAFFPIMTSWQILFGFLAFRFFDILKPWPVKAAESWLPGGFGIMIDDIIAGLYGALCLFGARFLYLEYLSQMFR